MLYEGRNDDRSWYVRVEARPATTLSLAFDHRLLDGAQAGRALRALADVLESPFELGSLPR